MADQLIVTDPFDTDIIAWACTRFGAVEVSLEERLEQARTLSAALGMPTSQDAG